MRRSTERRSWPSSTGPRGSRAERSTRRGPPATRPRRPARTRRWRASSPRTTTPRRPATSCARRSTSSSGRAPDAEMVRLEAELGRAYLMSGEPDLALPVIEAGAGARGGGRPARVDRGAARQPRLGGDPGRPAHGGARAPAGRRRRSATSTVPECPDALRHEPVRVGDGRTTRGARWPRRTRGWRSRVVAGSPAGPARSPGTGPRAPSRWGSGMRSWPSSPTSTRRGCCPPTRAPTSSSGVYLVRAYRGGSRRGDGRPGARPRARRWTTSRSRAATTTRSAHLRFAAGDDEAMRRHAAELLRYRAMYPYDAIPAARASLWLRDAAGMREALGERDVSVGTRHRSPVRR